MSYQGDTKDIETDQPGQMAVDTQAPLAPRRLARGSNAGLVTEPRPRPRVQNPAVDEVIQSGEITVPRSRVIRTMPTVPAFNFQDEPTTQSIPELAIVESRRHYRWLIGAAVATVVGLAAVIGSSSNATSSSAQFEPIAELIGTITEGDARAALVRAQAIASSPMLRNGIQTDPQTVADMDRETALVQVEGAEVVEVFQILGDVRTLMLRVPAGASPIQSEQTGQTRIESKGGEVTVVATAEIPKQQSAYRGEVVIAVPIDLEPIKKRVSQVARSASLVGFGAPVVLVAKPGDLGAEIKIPIKTSLGQDSMSLLAAAAPLSTSGLRFAGYGFLGLAGALLIVWRRSRAV